MSWGTGWWGYGPWGGCTPFAPDVTAPQISAQDPAPGASGILSTAPIIFRLDDGGPPDAEHVGVDLSTVHVLVTQGVITHVAVQNGIIQPGFNGLGAFLGANPNGGFDLILQPSVPWIVGANVDVDVACSDGNCNAMTAVWSFLIGTCLIEPCVPITSISAPAPLGGWGNGFWGSSPWGGGGAVVPVIIPITGGGLPIISTFLPITGPTTGGTDFVITGAELACFAFNDIFSDASINLALWTPIGAGSVVEGPYGLGGVLKCATGSIAPSYAGVLAANLKPKRDFHVEAKFEVQTPFLVTKPSDEVILAALLGELDNGNFIQISFVMKGPTETTGTIRCEVWFQGTQVHIQETATSVSSGTLGLMRYYDPTNGSWRAAFWFNGAKIYDVFDCPFCTMDIKMFTYNGMAAYNVETWFDDFVSHSVVVFAGPGGADVATNMVEVTEQRIRGKTPPSLGAWAGLVDVYVSNGSGNGCFDICSGCFTYDFIDAFVVGRSEPYRPTRKELSITNDPTLRNPNLNIGHGLPRQV